jgi:hypothetical protein
MAWCLLKHRDNFALTLFVSSKFVSQQYVNGKGYIFKVWNTRGSLGK